MNCPDCSGGGRLSVQSTIPWEGSIWRCRRCPDCDATSITVERFAGGWPDGMFTKAAKLKRRPGLLAKANAGREDHFSADAGADLANVMAAFTRPVAPAQHLDLD